MSRELIRVEGVDRAFGPVTVLQDINIMVNEGDRIGIVGHNGAGKTTSFYMIVGLIKPNDGRIFLDDENITGLPMYRRAKLGIGYLAQEASVFRNLASPPTPAIDIFKDFLTPSVGFKKLSVSLEEIE